MDDIVKSYYQDYKQVIVSLQLASGIWPDYPNQSKILRILRSILTFSMIWILSLGVLNYTIHARSITGLVAGIGSLGSFVSVLVKGTMLMLLRQDVKNLNDGLSVLFEDDLKIPEYRVHLLPYYRKFYRLYKAQYCCTMGFVVFGISVPVVEAMRGNYIRAYNIRVPFDYTPGDHLHWIIFAFEVISSVYMGMISFNADALFGLFALHMAGELHLLSHRLRDLKPGTTYKQDLKECIDRHCSLIDYKYKIDRVFGLISILIALTCAIVICSVIFQITQNKNVSLFRVIYAVDYMAAKWFQSYSYGWYGNTITVESERCLESMYFAGWTDFGNTSIGKDVIIIQSQSPIYINALGIMLVRLDMFIKVARATISYFCLLKTLETKFA